MRLYPNAISALSRDVLKLLMLHGDVEVEPLRIADVEMDLTAIMREYLTTEDRVNQATREALERRGFDYSKFNQVKRELAEVRGFKLGDEGIHYIANQMADLFLVSHNVEEVFAPDDVLRQRIFAVMTKHLIPRSDDPSSGQGGVPPAGPGFGNPPTGAPATLHAPDDRTPGEQDDGRPEYEVDNK